MRNKTASPQPGPPAAADPRPLRGAAHRQHRGEGARLGAARTSPVTVTASATKGLEATLLLAEAFAKHGYVAVPHLAARMIHDRERARARSASGWREAGITRVFVPGGDADPVGDYPDSFSLLEDLHTPREAVRARRDHRLPGVPPEDHRRPDRAGDVGQAPARDPRGQQPDLRRRRDQGLGRAGCGPRGITMPLLLGMPGPIDRAKLLTMATKIGVGESTRFLAKNKGTLRAGSPPRAAAPARSSSRGAPPSRRSRSPSSRACTSSPSTRSPRPRRGAQRVLTWTGCGHGLRHAAATVLEPPRSRPSRSCPVGTTVSGRPSPGGGGLGEPRAARGSRSWASQTTRV